VTERYERTEIRERGALEAVRNESVTLVIFGQPLENSMLQFDALTCFRSLGQSNAELKQT
jgi:hypothetical protein